MFSVPQTNTSRDVFHTYVENEWDSLAEVAIPTFSVSNPWLEHVAFLLEAHGVIVHRIRAPLPLRPVSSPVFSDFRPSDLPQENSLLSSMLPLNLNLLVFGTRAIETPPIVTPPSFPWRSPGLSTRMATARLLSSLENAQANVIRLRRNSASDGDDDDGNQRFESEDSFKLHPADIVIVSPNAFITRLSGNTNNKGLEYLWSVLAQPSRNHDSKTTSSYSLLPSLLPERPIPLPLTTTLIVNIREPNRPLSTLTGSPSPKASSVALKRHSLAMMNASKQLQVKLDGPGLYIPLSRVIVPVNHGTLFYDPSCLASGEARRLKSVMDRLQDIEEPVERPRTPPERMSMLGVDNSSSRPSSRSSYGTFVTTNSGSSTAVEGDEGWHFIPVSGLHKASVLLISPSIALVSAGPQGNPMTEVTESLSPPPDHKILRKVCQILESLGIQAIPVPCSDATQQGIGVREAVTVLRREPELPSKTEHTASTQDESDEEGEGCFDAITTATSYFWRKLKSYFSAEQPPKPPSQ